MVKHRPQAAIGRLGYPAGTAREVAILHQSSIVAMILARPDLPRAYPAGATMVRDVDQPLLCLER